LPRCRRPPSHTSSPISSGSSGPPPGTPHNSVASGFGRTLRFQHDSVVSGFSRTRYGFSPTRGRESGSSPTLPCRRRQPGPATRSSV
jgi:hypothetical protein